MSKAKITYCCMDCGNQIERHNALYHGGRCNSCSHKGSLHYNFLNGKIDCQCYICNKVFKRYKSHIRKFNFCSKSCEYKYRSVLFQGKNHPNWQGGLDKYGYPSYFNEELKLKIRIRDNFECQNCHMTEEEHLIVLGRNLNIHHIDYNKENCEKTNLITTCQQCNVRANSNRDYWFAFYTYKIEQEILKNG